MGEFEKDLRDAFAGAEFAPSEQVWQGVQKGLRPKKKGIFLMWQTYGIAATLIFLLTMGFLLKDDLFTQGDPGTDGKLSQTEQPKEAAEETTPKTTAAANTETPPSTGAAELVKEDVTPSIKDLQASNSGHENNTVSAGAPNTLKTSGNGIVSNDANDANDANDSNASKASGVINNLITDMNAASAEGGEELLIDISEIELLTLADLKESIAAIRNRWELKNMVGPMTFETGSEEDLPSETALRRTSLNGVLSGGNFNPNGSATELASSEAQNLSFNDPRFDASRVASSTDETQLGSLSVGFGVVLPLGSRWVFKTGLRYSQYRFGSNSNAYSIENGQSLPIYTKVAFDNTQVLYAGEYQLTNTLHTISVPAQVGLRVLNLNRFSTWVNMGVAVDYIASYTIKGDLNFLETRKVDFQQDSFFNQFNLNVLTGLELSYQLNEKFALSGEVFFRQNVPLTGTVDGAFEGSPSFFGFGLGVNYYLKQKD